MDQINTKWPDPGPIPELRKIDKRLLRIDPSYQRAVSSKRGQDLIAKIAKNWRWAYATVLLVVARDDLWVVIDGQHRHQAALRRPDINDLLCLVIDAPTENEQAAAFLAHNLDRIPLTSLAIFHASYKRGDEIAIGVVEACAAAGVSIRRTSGTVDLMKPNETIATGAMQDIVRTFGRDHMTATLKIMRDAFGSEKGQLRANVMRAVASLIKHGAEHAVIVKALRETDGYDLEDKARALRQEGFSIPQGFVVVLAKMCDITVDAKTAVSAYHTRKEKPPKVEKIKAPKPPSEPKPKHQMPAPEPVLRSKTIPKPAAKPFVLKRATPAQQAKLAKPQEFRGDVAVRRFEGGGTDVLIERTLQGAGLTAERTRKKGKDVYMIGHRRFTYPELIEFVDDIRKKKNLPLISSK